MPKSLLALLALLFWMTLPQPATAQEVSLTPSPTIPAPGETGLPESLTPVLPGISDPLENAILNGVVTISGSAPGAWELAFAYQDDPTGTWFPLAAASEALTGDFIPAWDTTVITDGFYLLRLRVLAADSAQDYLVNIRIRNYSATETPTPAATPTVTPTPSVTPLPSATPTVTYTPAPPPTPLPPNPATLPTHEIALNFGKGALAVTAVFALFGLLLTISKKLRS
jgi:hypothetical protein